MPPATAAGRGAGVAAAGGATLAADAAGGGATVAAGVFFLSSHLKMLPTVGAGAVASSARAPASHA